MSQNYKIHISSKHRIIDLHIRETFQYRDLIVLFIKKSFTVQYKQTIMGPAWAVINPLLTTIVFTFVFGNLARLTTADIVGEWVVPNFLFYMAGNICWGYFASTLSVVSSTFLANRGTMGKVYYPRLVAPISTALVRMISFGIQFALFLVFWIYYLIRGGTSIRITPWLFMIPLVLLQMMMLAIGLGMIISSVTTKYRDLGMLVGFGLDLWRYGCPIAYGLLLVPQNYMRLYMLNPVTPILVTFRHAVFGFGYFSLPYYLISWGVSIVVFMIGLILFSRVERTFMDTI